ncbi:hypothetical protein AAHA92_05174 [Salvia divinorum]|uniref:Ty3 transposon capsid-like protein domain-containing protein n=1 Tax=Salvia divinorum TaxID=28513 RepID=A0ABD1I2S5_SALDI
MANYPSTGLRTESLVTTALSFASTIPVVSQLQETSPIDPMKTTLERIVATMARFEARMDEYDRRPTPARRPTRPEPDPPYGMPFGWATTTTLPPIPPSPAVSVAVQQLPYSAGTPLAAPPFLLLHSLPSAGPPQPEFNPNRNTGAMQLGFPDISQQNTIGPPGFPRHPGPQRSLAPNVPSAWDLPQYAYQPNSWDQLGYRQGLETMSLPMGSAWDHPAVRNQTGAHPLDQSRNLKMDAPRFDGSNVMSWISRVQYYFDHWMLPDDHRLHYVVMLFDPPVAEWIFNYRANHPTARWTEFLEDVRKHFDPKCFINYFGLLAKLCQTGSITDYNKEFDDMLNRIRGVPETLLLPIYIEGLQQPVRNQVKFQCPSSVAAAFALAQEFDSAIERPPAPPHFQCRNW